MVKRYCVHITSGRTHVRHCVHIVPCARPCKVNGDAGPYTFMPGVRSCKTWHRHECVWTCVTIYLARPWTGHNVYAVAYMCTPRDNDDANTLIANVIVTETTSWYWAWPSSVQLLVGLQLQIIVCFWHEHAAFQWSAFGRSTAGNDVVATIFISLFLFYFSPVFSPLSRPFFKEVVLGSKNLLTSLFAYFLTCLAFLITSLLACWPACLLPHLLSCFLAFLLSCFLAA